MTKPVTSAYTGIRNDRKHVKILSENKSRHTRRRKGMGSYKTADESDESICFDLLKSKQTYRVNQTLRQ
mgnify:CR=1 FL=1